MPFDVPKIVRSPGCDHGHDEESRNGRDVKIDILEAYIWTPERFRKVSDIYRSNGGYRTPPPGTNGPCWTLVERERGRPPLLVLLGPREGRGARPMRGCLFSFPLRPIMAHIAPGGVPVTSRYSGKIPISPGTLPISKHRLPMYQSLCLNHFETPCHVLDHIRDSEQPLVHQNA